MIAIARSALNISNLTILLSLAIFWGIAIGAFRVDFSELFQVFTIRKGDDLSSIQYIIFNIRLPRVLMAGITGAGLAVSGAAIQGLFRNPLADHTLIGVSNGAMLFAVIAIVSGSHLLILMPEVLQNFTVGFSAFAGGLGTTLLVYILSSKRGTTSVVTMLMAGIAVSAFAAAVAGIFIYLSNDQQLRDITFWSLGSFGGATWGKFLLVMPVVAGGIWGLSRLSKDLNAILLGEAEAEFLGVSVQAVKRKIIIITSLIVGVCIAMCGIIGFVGLIIPHFIRLIKGADYRFLIKSSALLGAFFLIITDTLARTIIAPAELPIGIITAMIGAPFFLWLLVKRRTENLFL